MNFFAYQKMEKNEETKTGKRKAGEGRKQATDFKEAGCSPSAAVQEHHGEKMVCARGVTGVTGTLGKANIHFNPAQWGRGPHHHVETAVDWCSVATSQRKLVRIVYVFSHCDSLMTTNTTNSFAFFCPRNHSLCHRLVKRSATKTKLSEQK